LKHPFPEALGHENRAPPSTSRSLLERSGSPCGFGSRNVVDFFRRAQTRGPVEKVKSGFWEQVRVAELNAFFLARFPPIRDTRGNRK
jgi:hypothetical protein